MTQSVSEKSPNTFWQDVGVGSASGMAAVPLVTPLCYFKNVTQDRAAASGPPKPFAKDPRVWYRGMGVFAASFAPTVAIQTAVGGLFTNTLGPLAGAMVGGMTSALAVCPAEAIMIQQQGSGKTLWEMTGQIYRRYGLAGFARGFGSTAVREGAFATAYLGATPLLKEKLLAAGMGEWDSQIAAGVIAGTAAATLSHPFDTRKTLLQANFTKHIPVTDLFRKSAFAGFGWRTIMVSTATIVMSSAQAELNAQLKL